ncbi:MAG TPA: tripartite tricarboxylate transporter substrate-binding protein, partial [Burkholderiales bacterium]|nr:tripartite tricarboxylate transporter substrate-binding protein [Burkholderiales bacterium]
DMKVEVWWGVMGPGAMPKELVTRINADIAAAVASPEMKERLESLSARPIGGNSERFAAFFREEMSRWAKVVRASGAHAD